MGRARRVTLLAMVDSCTHREIAPQQGFWAKVPPSKAETIDLRLREVND